MLKVQKMRVFLSFFLSFFFCATYAQGFFIGIKGGLSYSSIDIDETIGDVKYYTGNPRAGVHGGLMVRIASRSLFIQPEMLFTSSGGYVNVDSISATEVIMLKYNKLDVPVMVGLNLGKVFRMQGGLVGSILLKADAKSDIEGTVEDVKQHYADGTIGWHAGIGFDIRRITVDLMWEDNLSPFGLKIEGVNTDLRNSQLKLTVGIMIVDKLKRKMMKRDGN